MKKRQKLLTDEQWELVEPIGGADVAPGQATAG
jgi:hypothetical protein